LTTSSKYVHSVLFVEGYYSLW